jgi:hypothetical protein
VCLLVQRSRYTGNVRLDTRHCRWLIITPVTKNSGDADNLNIQSERRNSPLYLLCPGHKLTSFQFDLRNETEKSEHYLLIDGRDVADSIAKVSDQFRSIAIYDLSVRRRRHTRDVLGVCYTQYLGPLLERLIGALRAHQGVRIPMENLHTWTLACVARVRIVYEIRPLIRSVRKTLRTGLVCSERCVRTRTRETCVRNS